MRKAKVNKFAPQIDAELDLHGLYESEAIDEVSEFLLNAEQKKFQRVRVVTGKGKGVLQNGVRTWLLKENYVFETAKITEGGSGALIVKL